MCQNSTCSSSQCIASRHVIVSHNRSAFREALVQIARCVYVSQMLTETCIICENFYIFAVLLDNSAAWIGR